MALDVPAIPIASQTLKYIKAAYDAVRDEGGAGLHPIPSQQIPAGALVVGLAVAVVTNFVDSGTSTVTVNVGPDPLGAAVDPVAIPAWIAWLDDDIKPIGDGSKPITVTVTGDGYTDGSCYIYVFYV
jgi:hypothetical protein